ncbi:MAG: hypothetical protein ACK4IX_00095 [Candidatus Sericytochromatia bacterium]
MFKKTNLFKSLILTLTTTLLISILIFVIKPNFNTGYPSQEERNYSKIRVNMINLKKMIEVYFIEYKNYSIDQIKLFKDAEKNGYLKKLYKNPFTEKEIKFTVIKKIPLESDSYFSDYVNKGDLAYFCCLDGKFFRIYMSDQDGKIYRKDGKIFFISNE